VPCGFAQTAELWLALQPSPWLAKAMRPVFLESPMTAVYTVLVFIVVIFAINIYEFGRPD